MSLIAATPAAVTWLGAFLTFLLIVGALSAVQWPDQRG